MGYKSETGHSGSVNCQGKVYCYGVCYSEVNLAMSSVIWSTSWHSLSNWSSRRQSRLHCYGEEPSRSQANQAHRYTIPFYSRSCVNWNNQPVILSNQRNGSWHLHKAPVDNSIWEAQEETWTDYSYWLRRRDNYVAVIHTVLNWLYIM